MTSQIFFLKSARQSASPILSFFFTFSYFAKKLSYRFSFYFTWLRPWQTRTHCCGHIVADTNVSPFARARNICCRHKFCVRDTKNVSDFVQKHFVSATNVSQFAQPKKHHGQQCVRNNVSSFTRAFKSEPIAYS